MVLLVSLVYLVLLSGSSRSFVLVLLVLLVPWLVLLLLSFNSSAGHLVLLVLLSESTRSSGTSQYSVLVTWFLCLVLPSFLVEPEELVLRLWFLTGSLVSSGF